MNDQRTLIDARAAAELLGTTQRHVYSLVSNRLIPHFRVGAKLRFDRAELLAYVEEQRTEVVA